MFCSVSSSCTTRLASMRAKLIKMASNSIGRISQCFSSFGQSLPLYTKVDLCAISRPFLQLARCNLSTAAAQVKTSDKADENDRRKKLIEIPILNDFENRNPRNPEYFGYNKPRGYGTQKYRTDFYNK